jgi:hypothetical protein
MSKKSKLTAISDKHQEKGRALTVDDVISDLIQARNDGHLEGIAVVCQYVNGDDNTVSFGGWATNADSKITTFSLMGGVSQALHDIAGSN